MENFDKVKDIIVDRLGVDADKVTEDASFKDDLGADSLDIAELVMELEDEFGTEIPDEEAEKSTLLVMLLNILTALKNNICESESLNTSTQIFMRKKSTRAHVKYLVNLYLSTLVLLLIHVELTVCVKKEKEASNYCRQIIKNKSSNHFGLNSLQR